MRSFVFLSGTWLACLLCVTFTQRSQVQSLPLCAEIRGEREFGGRGAEQAVPPRENSLPALRPSRLEPQRLDGPQSGGVRLLLQWVTHTPAKHSAQSNLTTPEGFFCVCVHTASKLDTLDGEKWGLFPFHLVLTHVFYSQQKALEWGIKKLSNRGVKAIYQREMWKWACGLLKTNVGECCSGSRLLE